jgi:Uma2 family endonuclease
MATDTQASPTATGHGISLYRLTVRQYLKMIDAGVIPEGDRVELLGGVLVDQMTKHTPHNFCVGRLGRILHGLLPTDWIVREEKSLAVGRYWRPEPDIAVVRGPDDLYRARDPRATDVALIVEVAEATYRADRGVKWRKYAAAGIPTYWIVNLAGRQVEVFGDPAGRGRAAAYRQVSAFGEGAEVPVVIGGREVGRVAVSEILP